jgi:hypothetical protein
MKSMAIDSAHGIFLTLRSLVPARLRGASGYPNCSNPACRFMNVRPACYFCGGSISKFASSLVAVDRSEDVHFDFRDLHLP